MKELFRKELKEQFKVALIGLLVLSILLFVYWRQISNHLSSVVLGPYYDSNDTFQPLLSGSLLQGAAFFCAIFATFLGWLQVRAEKHRDLWGFLVHRPVTRNAIFWSKVGAGLCLYALGAGLPMGVLVALCAIPGHVAAPFEWGMVLPMLAIFLSGVGFYFAGALTGLREARWYGTRLFGLGAPVIATLGAFASGQAWQAFSAIALAILIVLIAAWGNSVSDGSYRRQPGAGKVALTLACLVSSFALIACGIGIITALFLSRDLFEYSYYQVTDNGSIYKVTRRGSNGFEVVDLQGKPFIDEHTGQMIKQADFNRFLGSSLYVETDFSTKRRNRSYERFLSRQQFFSPWHVSEQTLWYLTHDGRLVGYHGLTRRIVATITPPTDPQRTEIPARFVLPQNYLYSSFSQYRRPRYLASPAAVYRIDVDHQSVEPIFTVPLNEQINAYSEWQGQTEVRNMFSILAVTRENIRLIEDNGRVDVTLPYVPSYPTYRQISAYITPGQRANPNPNPWARTVEPPRYVVRFEPEMSINQRSNWTLPTQLKWISDDGAVRESLDLPYPNRFRPNDSVDQIFAAILLPIPVMVGKTLRPEVWWGLRFTLPILCAIVGWRLGSQYSFSRKRKVVWLFFHIVFGLPGFVAFLAVQEWPARVSCPNCRKQRVVDRENCEHCGSKFAPPETNGTEIFEPLEVG